MSSPTKPEIPLAEVHKAQAIARHHAGQAARAKGYDPAAVRALASYGQPTSIGEGEGALVLLPQTLQVQLAFIEHSKLFPAHAGMTVGDGLERLTHLALIYHDPARVFDLLTSELPDAEKQRLMRAYAFELAAYFDSPEAIELLSSHIAVQMQLTEAAISAPPEKKPPAPLHPGRGKPPHRRR